MKTEPTITLYHATNRYSAERMLVEGMGLDLDDYAQFYQRVQDYFNVPQEYLANVTPSESDECRGGVSFWPTLEQCQQISHYGAMGGEYRGNFVQALVKRAARFMKIPYSEVKHVVETITGGTTGPVAVVVDLPLSYIANPSVLGTSNEHFTLRKVPARHIRELIPLR